MAIAGRVAIVPKGEWSQDVTYDKLDLVTHNGNTFIAYKSSVGVEPVDGDTWMLVMQGIDPQDIENIIDGTTPVGDSNKLGGKGASEYLTTKGGTVDNGANTIITLLSTVLSRLELNNGKRRIWNQIDNTGGYALYDQTNSKAIIQSSLDGTNTFNGTASGNLPLTNSSTQTVQSDTTESPVAIKSGVSYGHSTLPFYNATVGMLGRIGFTDKNKPVYKSAEGGAYELLHSGNVGSYALPIDGTSTISSTLGLNTILKLKTRGSDDGYGWITFIKQDDSVMGYLGFAGVNNPTFARTNGVLYSLLHTGNSAKVVQATSAPSDTTAVWIDVTNKKTKAYIDGAWTVIA